MATVVAEGTYACRFDLNRMREANTQKDVERMLDHRDIYV